MKRTRYKRDGQDYILARGRGFLVRAFPEELVRQAALDWLIDELGVPAYLIRTEFSHRSKTGRRRADIVILDPEAADDFSRALAVIECKRDGVFLDDKTLEQAVAYADSLGALYVVLTNGRDMESFGVFQGQWRSLDGPLTWAQMLGTHDVEWAEDFPFERFRWDEIGTPEAAVELAKSVAERGALLVGQDSPLYLYPFVLDLFGLFGDDGDGPDLPVRRGQYQLLADIGVTRRTFGNAAGGTWSSEFYRSFVVKDRQSKNDFVVSLAVLPSLKARNHPRFGNSRGRTMLIVAVDDESTSHNALQLCLDDCAPRAEFERGVIRMRHNASMTAGKRGSVKRQLVLDYVEEHAPDLVRGKEIDLGELDLRRPLMWCEMRDVVFNLIRYALIRDQLRFELRAGERNRSPANP